MQFKVSNTAKTNLSPCTLVVVLSSSILSAMTSSYEADAATEALIAQLMAEDFGEAYADQMRPIGSHAGDYEEPLTSYERQCLDNPDMEDGEGGWNPPTPTIEAVEASTLPEGESWDSSINNDPRIESTPAFTSPENGVSNKGDCEGDVVLEESLHHIQDAIGNRSVSDEPLHHIRDPVNYHADKTTQSPIRQVSVPVHESVSPIRDGRRIISDPSRLENTADSPRQNPPSPILSGPTQPHAPDPIPILPNHSVPKDPTATHLPPLSDPYAPTMATNERLLTLINDTSKLNLERNSFLNAPDQFDLDLQDLVNFDTNIDTSTAKNKGKVPAPDTSPNPDERIRGYLDRYKALYANRDNDVDYSSAKNKGKAHEDSDIYGNRLAKYVGRTRNPRSGSADRSGVGIYGDERIDEESGLLFLRVPWPDSGRRGRELREAMDAQVHEVWVGEEETVESILLDIRGREEVRGRAWGSWGVDGDDYDDGDGIHEKGKGKAVEC